MKTTPLDTPGRHGYSVAMSKIRKVKPPRVIVSSSCPNLRIPRKKIAQVADFVARQEGVHLAEVDVAVVNSREIALLNRKYLNHAGDTDVLSFDLSDTPGDGIYAQIIVCGDVADRQAKLRGLTFQEELLLYVVHGLLHVMGYDDLAVRAAAKMHARQDELLSEFRKL